jgi:hypothetical protein
MKTVPIDSNVWKMKRRGSLKIIYFSENLFTWPLKCSHIIPAIYSAEIFSLVLKMMLWVKSVKNSVHNWGHRGTDIWQTLLVPCKPSSCTDN